MQLADRNNWSLSEAKAKVTSSELLLWKVFIERDVNAFHREDYFYAQIAQEIRRVMSKRPQSVKLDHFLLRFETSTDKGQRRDAESVETQTARSKAFWFGLTSVDAEPPKKGT